MTAESSAGGTQALTLVQALAAMMAGARDHGLPAQVRASVRQRVLDTLGICIAASSAAHLGCHPTVRARPGGCP